MNNSKYTITAYLDRKEIPDRFKPSLYQLMSDMWVFSYDLPPYNLEYHKKELNQSLPDHKNELWILVSLYNEVIAYSHTTWNIKFENTNHALTDDFYVKKEFRRQNIGKDMSTKIALSLPDQIDTLEYWHNDISECKSFHESIFGERKIAMKIRQSVSELSEFDREEISKQAINLRKVAESKGYQIVFVDNVDFTGIDLEKYVRMIELIEKDMPKEDTSVADRTWDVERYMKRFDEGKELDCRFYTFVALKDGIPAGMTETMINAHLPQVGLQFLTGVQHEYRGDNLGFTLKTIMLDKLLSETSVKYWVTDNAGSNEHMLRINDRLKYKEWITASIYEINPKEINP